MIQTILNILYPRRCILCDGILDTPDSGVCTPCKSKLKYIKEPVCKKCGKPIDSEQTEYCFDCNKTKHIYDQGKGVWIYRGEMKESIYRFKYSNRREYAAFYARETARIYSRWIKSKGVEVIIPIPIHNKKKKQRGYNQAELYAKSLGEILDIPVDNAVLVRVINTIPQKELDNKQRRKNLKRAFKIQTDSVQWKKVLIVDDVYTTGSTMDAAAELLRKAGVERVYFLSITIGKGY